MRRAFDKKSSGGSVRVRTFGNGLDLIEFSIDGLNEDGVFSVITENEARELRKLLKQALTHIEK